MYNQIAKSYTTALRKAKSLPSAKDQKKDTRRGLLSKSYDSGMSEAKENDPMTKVAEYVSMVNKARMNLRASKGKQ